MTFHRLISNNTDGCFSSVVDYELADFEASTLRIGQFHAGPIPKNVKLYIGSGRHADFLENPFSWPICSSKLTDIIIARNGSNIQVLSAPIFELKSNLPIDGYSIINIVKKISCLDIERSEIVFGDHNETTIKAILKIAIQKDRVGRDDHVFRIMESLNPVIISEQVAKDMIGKGLQGLALQRCRG